MQQRHPLANREEQGEQAWTYTHPHDITEASVSWWNTLCRVLGSQTVGLFKVYDASMRVYSLSDCRNNDASLGVSY
jgi:hypothetical protein